MHLTTRSRGARRERLAITRISTLHSNRKAFDFIHEDVNSTKGGRYVVCSEFHNSGGTPYDVDYYVGMKDGEYAVEDVVVASTGARLAAVKRSLI